MNHTECAAQAAFRMKEQGTAGVDSYRRFQKLILRQRLQQRLLEDHSGSPTDCMQQKICILQKRWQQD